jgi:transcriptional regulator with XRE-family HTH domain
MSLRQLGEAARVSAPFVSDIELNKRFPSEDTLCQIAEALDVSVDYLRSLDSRPPLDDLRRGGVNDPVLGFALRRIVEEGVSGKELEEFLERRLKDTEKK